MKKRLLLIKDKGLKWCFFRACYSLKILFFKTFPFLDFLLKRKTKKIVRLDLFSPRFDLIKDLLTNAPLSYKVDIINSAEKASKGVIRVFAKKELDYGFPVNWFLNPITGACFDKKRKWYKIPDFDKNKGDIKVCWEISRFSYFFLFYRAYLLTGDIKYYQYFSNHLDCWVSNNIYPFGINFKCGQECSIRMINILFGYSLFNKFLTNKDIDNIKYVVKTSFEKVLSNFNYAYKCQKNNHVLSELCGILAGSFCTNDRKMLHKAQKYLRKTIRDQFLDDGGYTQQSFVYQRLALQDLEVILFTMAKVKSSIDKASADLINSSLNLLFQCMNDDGDVPNYGSNDGSLIFPISIYGYRDFRSTVQTISVMLNKKMIFEKGFYNEEMMWFSIDPNLYDVFPINRTTSFFKQSGIFIYRFSSYWVMFLAKNKLNHMDNGHIDIWLGNQNIFCDSGTFSYASQVGDEFISAASHNTIYCKGKEQLYRIGKFSFYGQPKTNVDYISEHKISVTFKYKSGYLHKRTICLSENEIDIFDESNCHFNANFHTTCDIKMDGQVIKSPFYSIYSTNSFFIEKKNRSLFYQDLENIYNIVVNDNNYSIITKIKFNGGI